MFGAEALFSELMNRPSSVLLGQNEPMRRCAFFFALFTLLLLISGCKSGQEHFGGKPPTKTFPTAVSLSPSASELISSKLSSVKVLGQTAQCNWPASITKIPIVMKGVKPNYELIAQLNPSIVVYDDQLFAGSDIEKFKELGIDTFAITGNSIEEFERCIFKLGSKFHHETNCSEYVDTINAAIGAAEGAPPAKTLKVAVLMPGSGSEHFIVGTDSFLADVVRKSQGEIVGPKGDKFVPVSAESLVSMNPDVIICSGAGTTVENDSRLQTVAAVRMKRVIAVDPDILLRRGARVNNLIRGIYNILSEAASSQ